MSIIAENWPKACYEPHGTGWGQALAKPSRDLFVENLNRHMSRVGAKNVNLAKHVGVAPSVVTYWRKGTITPEVDKLSKIAEFLQIPTAELFRDTTDARTTGVDLTDVNKLVADAIEAAAKAAVKDLISKVKKN